MPDDEERLKAQLEVIIRDNHWFTDRQVQEVLSGERGVQEFEQWRCKTRDACITRPENLTVSCAKEYQGPLCAVCAPGFGSTGGNQCARCQNDSVSWILLVLILIIIVGIAVLAIMRVLRKASKTKATGTMLKRELLVTMKILFNFLQVLSFLSQFEVDWSTQVLDLFGFAGSTSGFSFNLSFVDCALGWNARQQYVFVFILPFLILIIPAVVISVNLLWHQKKARAAEKKDGVPLPPLLFWGVTPVGLYSTVVMVLLFLFYPTASRRSLVMVNCTDPVDGTRYVVDDFTVSCDDSTHQFFQVLAWIQLVLISFGFPILSAAVLFYNRDKLHHERIRRRFSFLYSGYERSRYWFESVIMARKFALIGAAVTLTGSSVGYQLFWGITILVVSLLIHLWFKPYQDRIHGHIEQLALIGLVFILLIGQLIAFQDLSSGMSKFLTSIIVLTVCVVTIVALSVLITDVKRLLKASSFPERFKQAFRKRASTGAEKLPKGEPQIEETTELPSDSEWEKRTHPSNGMIYYFNKKTKKSQWDKPAELEEAQDEKKRIAAAWDIKQHPKFKLPYYVNYITRAMSWERPMEMPMKNEECWEIRLDANGVPYYYNSLTDKTQWEQPEDFVPAPEQQAYLDDLDTQAKGGPSAGPPPAIQGAAVVRSYLSSRRASSIQQDALPVAQVTEEDIPKDAFVKAENRPFSDRIGLNWIRDRFRRSESGTNPLTVPPKGKTRRATSHRLGPIPEIDWRKEDSSRRSFSTEHRNSQSFTHRNDSFGEQKVSKETSKKNDDQASTFDARIRRNSPVSPNMVVRNPLADRPQEDAHSLERPRSEVASGTNLTTDTDETVISVRGPWNCFLDHEHNEYYWVNVDTGATLWQGDFERLYEDNDSDESDTDVW